MRGVTGSSPSVGKVFGFPQVFGLSSKVLGPVVIKEGPLGLHKMVEISESIPDALMPGGWIPRDGLTLGGVFSKGGMLYSASSSQVRGLDF